MLEAKLRDLGRLDLFSLMTLNADRKKVMQEVDNVCAKSVYSHSGDDCSPECKKQGKTRYSLYYFILIKYMSCT